MEDERYISCITVYTYGKDKKDALSKAQNIADSINEDFEGHEAEVESFYLKPHGSIKGTEIDLKTM